MGPRRTAGAAALLLLALSACSSDGDEEPTPVASGPTDLTPTSPSAATSPSASSTGAVAPATDLLDWQPVPGRVDATVTRSEDWTLSVPESARSYTLRGPDVDQRTGPANPRERVGDSFLDDDHAVVVWQDRQETRPARAEVTDLDSGQTWQVDGRSDVPTTTGGSWAVADGTLLHATVRADAYCLASVDLDDRTSSVVWCAPARQGFNEVAVGDEGVTLTVFDDAQPACRTVSTLRGREVVPLPGVNECTGSEGVLTDDGAVWGELPKPQQVERIEVRARDGDTVRDLGPGTAGTLVACGDASYFVRDPQLDADPARLLRWDGRNLAVVYETAPGQAFLTAPRCGEDRLTLTALTEAGDEQVTAAID